VTGEAFAPVLEELLTTVGLGERLRVLAVPNAFFGGNVSVTGLLTARDIAAAVASDRDGDVYALPDVVLNTDGLTLDDATIDDLLDRTRADIRLVSSDAAGLLQALRVQDFARDPRNEG
jgi:NifB/MoaA-like Fe-S oxidoreductase